MAGNDVEVLVAGAGPVGLAAAMELARLGHSVRIVDPVTERHPFSKALGINARTLELLAPGGATERILEEGKRMAGARFSGDSGELFRIQFSGVKHPFSFMVALSQARTEAILEERLSALGVSVERGVRLEAFEQSESGVSAELLDNDSGSSRQVTADWLLGADGAHSTVRKTLGLDFPGDELAVDWVLADVNVGKAVTESEFFNYANVQRNSRRFVFLLPVEPGILRVVSDDENVLSDLPFGLVIRDENDITWESRFRVRSRQVTDYMDGRVCLAGDAAHIHSPLGGRGMNMGIEDASFFVRCLHEGKMQYYAPWRHKVGRMTIGLVHAQTRLMTTHGRLRYMVFRLLAPRFASIGLVQKAMVKRNLGLHTDFLPPGF